MNHCRAWAEVMTPDAILREITCGKSKRGHGRWHSNRGVVWPGRFQPAETIAQVIQRIELREFAMGTF